MSNLFHEVAQMWKETSRFSSILPYCSIIVSQGLCHCLFIPERIVPTNMTQKTVQLQHTFLHRFWWNGCPKISSYGNLWTGELSTFVISQINFTSSFARSQQKTVRWKCDCYIVDSSSTPLIHDQRLRLPRVMSIWVCLSGSDHSDTVYTYFVCFLEIIRNKNMNKWRKHTWPVKLIKDLH